jgi:catechol 2,3-dioxygenase-like lactoylglutathione lyase family enzyme
LVARGNGYVYRFGGQYLSVHGPEDKVPYTARKPVRPGNIDLCFEWPGTIEEAVEHLGSHGVEVESGPLEAKGPLGRDGRHVYFRDPDGSLLEFVSYA